MVYMKSGITYENKIKIYMPNCQSNGDEEMIYTISIFIICVFGICALF